MKQAGSREVFTLRGSPGELLAVGCWGCQVFFRALVVTNSSRCIQQGLLNPVFWLRKSLSKQSVED